MKKMRRILRDFICDFDLMVFLKENYLLLIGAALLIAAAVTSSFILYLVSYLLIGRKVLIGVVTHLSFDENLLMAVATIGAFLIGEYPEAVSVMLFYQIGELFQDYAVGRSRRSISELLDIKVDSAHLVTELGVETIDVNLINIGDEIMIKPGERIPLDGIVTFGESYLDTAALTGESMLRFVATAEKVFAGCINTNAMMRIRVTSTTATSTITRILELVQNAGAKKAATEKFITKFARIYTPIVFLIAFMIAIMPALLFGADFQTWVYRSLVFLLVSCPCALVISIPLGFFAGIGGASRLGVLVKGANYLEALAHTHTVVFDKTGTLTKGNFAVSEIHPHKMSQDEFLKLAAHGEGGSNHPIAKSIVKAYSKPLKAGALTDYEEVSGHGIRALIEDRRVIIGNHLLMKQHGVRTSEVPNIGTVVHMIVDEQYAGYMVVNDEIKESAQATITKLKKANIKKIVMLTGDQKRVGDQVAADLGIAEVHCELLPHQKVAQVEKLLTEVPNGQKLVFVGDGMNDAPVLARADIGVAMGGLGSEVAIEAADIVLMKDDPESLVDALYKSQQTNQLLYQNIALALGVKVILMTLSLFGITTMWAAVFGDVGVTIIAILNSIRALKNC